MPQMLWNLQLGRHRDLGIKTIIRWKYFLTDLFGRNSSFAEIQALQISSCFGRCAIIQDACNWIWQQGCWEKDIYIERERDRGRKIRRVRASIARVRERVCVCVCASVCLRVCVWKREWEREWDSESDSLLESDLNLIWQSRVLESAIKSRNSYLEDSDRGRKF